MFVELALRSPASRGSLVDLDKLEKAVTVHGKNIPVYRSVYLYDKDGYEYVNKNKSVRGYMGWRGIDYLPIDIDKVKDKNPLISGKKTIAKAKIVNQKLLGLGLKDDSYCIFFSGTGFHFLLPSSLFGFENHEGNDLPYIVKSTMKKLLPEADMSIYSRSALYRCAATKNYKTQLYKTYITSEQLEELPYTTIAAKGRKWDINDFHTFPSEEQSGYLESYVTFDSPSVKAFFKTSSHTNVVPCIQDMYNNPPAEGNRHNTLMRIVSHFRRNGIPIDATIAAMEEWNKGEDRIKDSELLSSINDVYTKGYQYGCMDSMMMTYCQSHCIYFKRKDYLMNILNVDDLQVMLNKRMKRDFSGVSINLSKLYGLVGVDSVIYPGELVTIVGPTGTNKTTLAQNIALAYNAIEDKIEKELQIPTLYLSLELAPWLMHRRNIQIVSDTETELIQKGDTSRTLYDIHREEIDHIQIQTVSPTVEKIREQVRKTSPACIVIDYIDLIEPPNYTRGEYESIRHISHALSNLAVNYDMIIIQLSQTSREYSRAGTLDLYAGKGSGAIENASRKLLVLEGEAKERKRRLKMVKSTDGELWSVDLKFHDSFRLKRI